MFKAVLWDIDGTFVDSEPSHNRALLETLAVWNIHPAAELQRRVIGTSVQETHGILRSHYENVPDLDAFIAAKMRAYLSLSAELKLRAGVEDAMRWMARRPLRRAFVSNSDRILVDANLRAVGLMEPGLITVSINDVRKGKPDPESYLRAAHLLGVDAQACVVVDDSPAGVVAGLAAGMSVVAWPEPETPHPRYPSGAFVADPRDVLTTLNEIVTAAE